MYFTFPSGLGYLLSSLPLYNISALVPQLKAVVQTGDIYILDVPLARLEAMEKFVGIFLGLNRGGGRSY